VLNERDVDDGTVKTPAAGVTSNAAISGLAGEGRRRTYAPRPQRQRRVEESAVIASTWKNGLVSQKCSVFRPEVGLSAV